MNNQRLLWRVVFSLLLGAVAVGIIAFGEMTLPHGPMRDDIMNAFSLPAVLIARVISPGRAHTGVGAPNWDRTLLYSNVFFYSVVWFAVLSWASVNSRRTEEPHLPR